VSRQTAWGSVLLYCAFDWWVVSTCSIEHPGFISPARPLGLFKRSTCMALYKKFCGTSTQQWLLWQVPEAIKKLNSVAWVRERTMPTERPPLVGELSANFCG
jgi:hypothetical protein